MCRVWIVFDIVYIYITLFSIFTFYFLYIIYSKQSILNDALCLSGRLHLRLIINMYGWMVLYIVLSILFLNILLWSIYYVYPQPDPYIIKINRYSNIATMTHVRMRMYILSLIYFIYQFIINIHPYTCMHTYTHQHTHAYIGMHPYIHMHP